MTQQTVAVVIDVFRAFTTAAVAFDRGVPRIICVKELDDAFDLKRQHPRASLMGEDHGPRPENFDLGNSPDGATRFDFNEHLVIQRTSNGTAGLVEANTEHLFAASAVAATATARHLIEHFDRARIEFVPTRPGAEDQACADFMSSILDGRDPDPVAFHAELRTIADASIGRWTDRLGSDHPEVLGYAADLAICCDVDRFDTAMVGHRTKHGVELQPAG